MAQGVVDGNFSSTGRNTDKDLRNMRKQVAQSAAEMDAAQRPKYIRTRVAGGPAPLGGPRAKSAAGSSTEGFGALGSGHSKGVSSPTAAADANGVSREGSLARTVGERLGLTGHITCLAGEKAAALSGVSGWRLGLPGTATPGDDSPKQNMSSSFTATGKETELADTQCMTTRRIVRVGKQHIHDATPEAGRYKVQYNRVLPRVLGYGFGEKPKTQSLTALRGGGLDSNVSELEKFIMSPEASTMPPHDLSVTMSNLGLEPGREMMSPRMRTRIRLMTETPRSLVESTSFASGSRPDLAKLCRISMKDISAPADDRDDQDLKMSHNSRPPEWNFAGLESRKPIIRSSYFEPGKYKTSQSEAALASSPNSGVKFQLQSPPRDAKTVGHSIPPACLTESTTSVCPDRSLHRTGPWNTPRVTHLQEFQKDLPRPDLIKLGEEYHDECDPMVRAQVHESSMAFDAIAAIRLVRSRNDHSLNMGQTVTRQQSLRGNRMLQCDLAVRTSLGFGNPESIRALECPVDLAKEPPSRIRVEAVHVAMQHFQGRKPSKKHGEFGSMRRPRSMAAPDFARATNPGFAKRIGGGLGSNWVTQKSRAHEAMPGWADWAEAVAALADESDA